MSRAFVRRAARASLILSAVITATCGGSPTQPTPPAGAIPLPAFTVPPFPEGQYVVQISGADFSSDANLPACDGPIGVPRAGKMVTVDMRVVRSGTQWVGRSADPGDAMEFRFRDSGDGAFGVRRYVGTLRGRARDSGLAGRIPPRDVEILIGDGETTEIAVTGENLFSFRMSTLGGQSQSGSIAFRDSDGHTGRCSVVRLHINTAAD